MHSTLLVADAELATLLQALLIPKHIYEHNKVEAKITIVLISLSPLSLHFYHFRYLRLYQVFPIALGDPAYPSTIPIYIHHAHILSHFSTWPVENCYQPAALLFCYAIHALSVFEI
jgi:hypothetical protein